jgi:hypothetical protein
MSARDAGPRLGFYAIDALEGVAAAVASEDPNRQPLSWDSLSSARDATRACSDSPTEQRQVERATATIIELLGRDESSKALNTGRAMTLSAGAAYALRAQADPQRKPV